LPESTSGIHYHHSRESQCCSEALAHRSVIEHVTHKISKVSQAERFTASLVTRWLVNGFLKWLSGEFPVPYRSQQQ